MPALTPFNPRLTPHSGRLGCPSWRAHLSTSCPVSWLLPGGGSRGPKQENQRQMLGGNQAIPPPFPLPLCCGMCLPAFLFTIKKVEHFQTLYLRHNKAKNKIALWCFPRAPFFATRGFLPDNGWPQDASRPSLRATSPRQGGESGGSTPVQHVGWGKGGDKCTQEKFTLSVSIICILLFLLFPCQDYLKWMGSIGESVVLPPWGIRQCLETFLAVILRWDKAIGILGWRPRMPWNHH